MRHQDHRLLTLCPARVPQRHHRLAYLLDTLLCRLVHRLDLCASAGYVSRVLVILIRLYYVYFHLSIVPCIQAAAPSYDDLLRAHTQPRFL